ncbi:MAG TPA: hypothetical protein V6C57_19690 [Coleofasciculaceae cyanobacterium]
MTTEEALWDEIYQILQPPELRVFGDAPQDLFDDTQTVIAWLQEAWTSDPFEGEHYAATEEVTAEISGCCYTTDHFEDIGSGTWDRWTEIQQLREVVKVPKIDEESVDWEEVGKFVIGLLKVDLPKAEED